MNCKMNYSAEDLLQEWNYELVTLLIPNNVLLALYLIIGILGNSLILFVYVNRMKTGQDERYFIPTLAVMDLLSCVVNCCFALSLNILSVRYPSDTLCKTLWFFGQSTSISSGMILFVIALNRYMVVCKPLLPKWTLKRKRMAVAIAVLVSCVVSVPSAFYIGVSETFNPHLNVTGFQCTHLHEGFAGRSANIFFNIFIFVSGSVIMITASILYINIWRKISKKILKSTSPSRSTLGTCSSTRIHSVDDTRNVYTRNSVSIATSDNNYEGTQMDINTNTNARGKIDPGHSAHLNLKSKKSAKSQRSLSQDQLQIPRVKRQISRHRYSFMFMTLTIVFVISFLPKALMLLLESLLPNFWMETGSILAFMLFLYRLYIINNVANPFIYGFFDGKFRDEVKKLLCNCGRK